MHTFKKCHITAGCLFSALLITFASHAYAAADATAGKTAAAGGDFVLAEKEWRAAAKAGNADAQYHLGALLITDKLGAPKVEEGVQWWRQAALQGHELGEWEQVDEAGLEWEARCQVCGRTTFVSETVRYSVLGEICSDKIAPKSAWP